MIFRDCSVLVIHCQSFTYNNICFCSHYKLQTQGHIFHLEIYSIFKCSFSQKHFQPGVLKFWMKQCPLELYQDCLYIASGVIVLVPPWDKNVFHAVQLGRIVQFLCHPFEEMEIHRDHFVSWSVAPFVTKT